MSSIPPPNPIPDPLPGFGPQPFPPNPPGPYPEGPRGTNWLLVGSLIGGCALVFFVGAMFLLLFPAVQSAREAGRRAMCSNHFRMWSISVHEYHDTYNQLPPLATDDKHWSWVTMLLPFDEGTATYQQIELWNPAGAGRNAALVQQFRSTTLSCPSRRAPAKSTPSGGALSGEASTDYVAVSTTQGPTWGANTDGVIVFRAEPPTRERPFPRSATTISSVTDGMANTAMIGEKHMRPDWLGGKLDEPALVALANQNTIRVAGDTPSRGLAPDRNDQDDWKFGGWHPGVTLFAMGDASVHSIKNNTDPSVLKLLMSRNDGTSFVLPWDR